MKAPFLSFRSVRQKLFAGVLLTSIVALVVTGTSMFLYDLHTHRERSAGDLEIEARLIGNATMAALQFDDAQVAAQNLAFLKADPEIRAAAVYNPRGAIFARYARPGAEARFPELPGADGITITGDRISVFRRISSNNESVGTVYLEADLGMYERIASYAVIALAVTLGALLAALLLSAWLQKSITHPIIQISGLARHVVERRDYSVRATRTTDDEIGTLVEAFNEMLAEIQRRTSALNESEAGLRRAQSLAKLGHVVSNPDGSFASWSETLPQLLQQDEERMPRSTRAWLDLVHPEDRMLFRSKAIEAGASGRRTALEYRLVRADGSSAHMRQVMEPLETPDATGKRRWFSTLQDVTEQKQAEEEVRRLNADLEKRVASRTAQLEESNRQLGAANEAKSNFLSMMSHEIRTPMNGVIGMLELLALSELDAPQRSTLNVVQESGRSLLRIIDDILDFSKIEAGKLEVRPEVASIAKVAASVVAIYSGNASSKGLVLTAQVDSRISPAVMVDPLRLQQVLNNLVSNAIKFTSTGTVEIRAELIERRDKEDVVRLSVADSGIGISSEGQALLFQPFAQASGDITRVFGGTGLGLSISERLAKLMGGSIAIASEVGKGTTISVTLPLPIADPKALPTGDDADEPQATGAAGPVRRQAPSIGQAETEGTLVLLADDHPINRLVLMRQAASLGYAVEAVENGREALELWKTGRFALVITDCNMPEMDGYELARAIRALEAATAKARTAIIACTANALRGEAENCFAAGMDDYIPKPVQLAQLRKKLDQWLPLVEGNAPAQALIDPGVLADITGGNAAMEREVIAQFLLAHEKDVALFARAMEAHDLELLTHVAHRISGASKTIGATALGDASGRIEAASRAHDWEAVTANLETFHREMARLVAYLRATRLSPASSGTHP
jgi:PAS domain S-box-containing protein